jgi:hypothetical protein
MPTDVPPKIIPPQSTGLIQDLLELQESLRTHLPPVVALIKDVFGALAERLSVAFPPEAHAAILHMAAEQEEATTRRERWTTQLAELASTLGDDDSPRWEAVSIFWIRLYGLHDLKKHIAGESLTAREQAALDAISAVCDLFSADEWEVVRYFRNNEGHPWADRHAASWSPDGQAFQIKTPMSGVADVRDLTARRSEFLERHGGEVGFARSLATRISPKLPPMIAAMRAQTDRS